MSSKLVVVTLPVLLSLAYYFISHHEPPLSPPHKYRTLTNFLSDEDHNDLQKVLQNIKDFPAARSDWTSTDHWSHIGEAMDPIVESYDANTNITTYHCPDPDKYPYLVYNDQIHKCVFANRIDIARHFILTGGYDGWKETFDIIASRLLLYNNYQFNVSVHKEFIKLFNNKEFVSSIDDICGNEEYPYFRPYQLSLIMQMPGQNVPAHLDIPFFIGASRYLFPQWLLLVMQHSGLFKERRIPQVQALVYMHDWMSDNSTNDSESYRYKHGEFVFWPNGPNYPSKAMVPAPKSAIFCDGSEAIHATATYKPETGPVRLNKDEETHLSWDDSVNAFRLYVNELAREETYTWEQIRSSIVYRGWCFKSEKEMNEYDPKKLGDLTLDDILNILKNDLIKNNKISRENLNKLTPYEFGQFLMDEYIDLPYPPNAIIKFNYCMIGHALPQWIKEYGIVKSAVSMFENIFCNQIMKQ